MARPPARALLPATVTVATMTVAIASCQVTTGPRAPAPGVPAAGPVGQAPQSPPGPEVPTETFRPTARREHARAPLFLAGSQVQQLVNFDVIDGLAVMEGDIVLGPANTLALTHGVPWAPATNVKSAVALANRSYLWPRSEIPYLVDGSVSPTTRGYIDWAIAHLATTPLKLRPKQPADRDFVVFRDNGPASGCSSYVGRVGGPQDLFVSECARGSIVHELLHAAGFYHEQSRGDRDAYVTIVWDEIVPQFRNNFEKRDGRGQDIGPYDYASIMHYSPRSFSRSGNPTIVPKATGVRIGQREALSEGDRAALEELYGDGPPPAPTPTVVTPPVVTPPVVTPPTTPTTPVTPTNPTAPPVAAQAGFAGSYSSNRGNVACTQSGSSVTCQYPGGNLFCGAAGAHLDCAWSGGGGGRAAFERQSNGVLAGTYGDFISNTSRGKWDLVPAGPAPTGPGPTAPPAQTAPPQTPPPPPTSGPVSLAGNYSTTRGAMACTEHGSVLTCGFQEAGVPGRLDCIKDQPGLQLSCTWATSFPRPGSGRAVFTRPGLSVRSFTGTWGHLHDAAGGGRWDLTGQ